MILSHMPDLHDDLDPVFRGLANAHRRRILDLLKDGAMTTGDLADRFPDLSRFAVMQHLKVLEEAELVVPRRSGRHRFNHLNVVPLQRIQRRWVSTYSGGWADALVGLKADLERAGEEKDEDTTESSGSVA